MDFFYYLELGGIRRKGIIIIIEQCFSKSGPGGNSIRTASISYFKSTNYISSFDKRMWNLNNNFSF